MHKQLERLVKARFGADHPYYAVALNKQGIIVQAQGKYTEAEGLFKRALVIREKAESPRRGAEPEQFGQRVLDARQVQRG
jgi:Tetratricopeptide repeat